MTFKTTLRLLVTVCLLAIALLVVECQTREHEARKAESRQVFDLAREPITGIGIARSNLTIECVKKADDWFLNAPVRARGNAAIMGRIGADLEALQWEECITAEQRAARELSLVDYGLDPPHLTVSIDTAQRRQTLHFGDPTPLGTGWYARRGHSDEVLAVPDDIVSALPDSVDPLRDRALLHGSPAQTVRLEISRSGAGFIQLVRQNGGWMIQQPLAARADAAKVQALLEALYSLRIGSFFWDVKTDATEALAGTLEMAASARIESCGLASDAAQLRVTVWVEGDSLGQELLLGKADPDRDGEVFAKRGENDAIYTISDAILEKCSCNVNSLRDRRIFSMAESEIAHVVLQLGETKLVLARDGTEPVSWRVVEPVQWDAENASVHDLVEQLLALSVHAYQQDASEGLVSLGLDPPQYAVTLGGAVPVTEGGAVESPVPARELHVGALRPERRTRYARIADEEEVFAVEHSQMTWFDAACVNPLRYRDRTMLALKATSVRRITVATPQGEHGVERGADQVWACVGATDLVPAVDTIRQILFAVEDVRAVQIEELSPKSLEPYGLELPAVAVTFGIQGDAGIQKSLLIGKSDSQGRVYATVRGQDIVFMIPDALASLFAKPLCVPFADGSSAAGEGD
jgi:hypothetical protein